MKRFLNERVFDLRVFECLFSSLFVSATSLEFSRMFEVELLRVLNELKRHLKKKIFFRKQLQRTFRFGIRLETAKLLKTT